MVKNVVKEDGKVTYQVGDQWIDIKYIKIKKDNRTCEIEIQTENGKLEFASTEYYLANYYMHDNHLDIVRKWEW